MMRLFRWLLCGAVVLCPAAGGAADETMGVIMSGNITYYQEAHKAFVAELAREGFDSSRVDILLQRPSPDPLSWSKAAHKLATAEVSLLMTYGAPAALASIRETKSIPVVYACVYDPEAIGVEAWNAAGVSSKVPMTSLLKYLKKLVNFTRLAVVYNESEPDSVRQVAELQQLEAQYGFQTVKLPVSRPGDARTLVFADKADAVLFSVSAVVNEELDGMVKLAHAAGIPTASQMAGAAEKGVILSLSASPAEQGKTAAKIAARILRGESPAGIPLEVPKRVELVLNAKEAEALGIKIPIDLITNATKVIK